MKIFEDFEFKTNLLKKIAEREFAGKREGVHCTDLIYCLNKQALRRLQPQPIEEHELLLFSLGWSTQRWLTGQDKDEPEIELDGIKVTMDALMVIPWELKCTYQSSAKPIADNQNWLKQIMAQCYVSKNTKAYLSRLELMGDWKSIFKGKDYKTLSESDKLAYDKLHEKPTLHAFRLEFDQTEVDDNWAWLRARKALFLPLLATGKLLPKSLAQAPGMEYECGYCNKVYREQCGC